MRLGFNKKLFFRKLEGLILEEERVRKNLIPTSKYWLDDFSEVKKNHKKIEKILGSHILEHGWPGIPVVGWEAALAAAQLSCQCTTNPKFMRFCFPFIEQSYRFGSVPGSWFVQFYDTIMHFEGKPQVFATFLDWDKDGLFKPINLLDPAGLANRRAEFNVDKISEVITSRPPVGLSLTSLEDFEQYVHGFHQWAESNKWRESAAR